MAIHDDDKPKPVRPPPAPITGKRLAELADEAARAEREHIAAEVALRDAAEVAIKAAGDRWEAARIYRAAAEQWMRERPAKTTSREPQT